MPRYALHRWLVVVVMVALLAAACGSEDSQSPLATWDPSRASAFTTVAAVAVAWGTLEITADCVRLIQSNQGTVVRTVVPVWPEPTSWNASSQVIEVVDVSGERLDLRAGDRIGVGGGLVREGSDPPFVVPPDSSCKADEIVIVNGVILVTD